MLAETYMVGYRTVKAFFKVYCFKVGLNNLIFTIMYIFTVFHVGFDEKISLPVERLVQQVKMRGYWCSCSGVAVNPSL